jgi:hypothetical protein
MKLSAKNVERVFNLCIERETKRNDELIVHGIVNDFPFNKKMLSEYADDIIGFLNELPKEFHENDGGGWSFLNACNDKNGNQWTGSHAVMEKLFVLGIGIDKVKLLLPREVWGSLPGGVPYFVVV